MCINGCLRGFYDRLCAIDLFVDICYPYEGFLQKSVVVKESGAVCQLYAGFFHFLSRYLSVG